MNNPVLKFLYIIWYIPVLTTLTIIGGTISFVVSFFSKKAARYITNAPWSYIALVPAGIRLKTFGQENLPKTCGNYIIYANHTSLLDIPTVGKAVNISLTWLAKASLAKIPFFGWALLRVHMLVDRKGGANAVKHMVKDASSRLQSGQTLAIFPEGTRNRGEEPLLPFKQGAFILAKHTSVPIVPVAIKNAKNLWPANKYWPKPGIIRIKIGVPFSLKPGENLASLTARAHANLLEMLTDESW